MIHCRHILILLLCSCLTLTAGETQRWAGVFLDVGGKPLADLQIHFWRLNSGIWEHQVAQTKSHGEWQIDLPVGDWQGAARPADLLARGYFCEPGFWSGSGNVFNFCGDLVPDPCTLLWGPGVIEWVRIDNPGNVQLTAFPTKPSLRVVTATQTGVRIDVEFETQQLQPMTTTRQWRVEKSTDLQHWTPVQTVALGTVSPLKVMDAASTLQTKCYYRAVQVEDL